MTLQHPTEGLRMTEIVAVANLLDAVCNTVNARLCEMGRSAIALSRDWLDYEDGERSLPRLIARVPIGSSCRCASWRVTAGV
jgi:hypothetical protein